MTDPEIELAELRERVRMLERITDIMADHIPGFGAAAVWRIRTSLQQPVCRRVEGYSND